MKLPRWIPGLLLLSPALACGVAFAQPAASGAGAMRCTTVISRLSSQAPAERLAVLSWVQGYLAGVATAREALVPAGAAFDVPEYDALGPRVLVLCKADPTRNLHQVATRFFASAVSGR
jgi:hypothetical protein